MCNIAGYIGKKPAAPVLAEMMKKQEGFWGGYYTGITTHDGQNLHTAKVIGDMENLLSETDCLSFPGNMGFLHSRSNGGGDKEWGHPFTNREGSVSYIANGSMGSFATEELNARRAQVAAELSEKGYLFRSKVGKLMEGYPSLPDGSTIHCSDLQCQHIASLIDSGLSPAEAMSQSNSELPSEIVGLVITKNHPDRIFVSRISCPMMIGITDDGDTYLATTAIAFPEDVSFRTIESLPPATTFEVYQGGFRAVEAPVCLYNIQSITPDIWHYAYERLEKLLTGRKDTPVSVEEAVTVCKDLWKEGMVHQEDPLVYGILDAMYREGKLKIKKVPVTGAFSEYHTENFRVYL